MKLRNPFLLRVLGWLAAGLIRLWMGTVRFHIDLRGKEKHPADPRRGRFLYAIWHESMLAPAMFARNVRVLISQHADGELITQVGRHLGIGAVRGSTTRGGGEALLTMCRWDGAEHLAVTPDGPRGPRRRVKLGVIFLASRSGLPVVPVGIGYSKAWRAGSWDRFAVPLPGSHVWGVVLPAIHVPNGLDRDGLERYRTLLEEQLRSATEAAERSAEGRPEGAARPAA
jgi:lysophospholipid acyltransferase (LPLAT)-like uncharacterized protein